MDENVALIQKLYAAFNTGDIATVLANVDADAEWVNVGPSSVPYYGDFGGRMGDFFHALDSTTSGGGVHIDRYVASGDAVVAEGRYTCTVRDTGIAIDSPIVHLFTVRNGKVTSWRGHGDTAAVVAAHSGKAATA